MGDELSEDSCFFDVPDCAGCIDGARTDKVVELGVPIEGGQRC